MHMDTMIDRIRTAIADRAARGAAPAIADWRISETRRTGSEWYFIRATLDSARSVEARDLRLSVCVDSGEGETRVRGEAMVTVHPTLEASELTALVERAAFAASKSRNRWYPLVGPASDEGAPAIKVSAFEARSPEAWFGGLREALFRGDGAALEAGRINSLELFLTRSENRVLNSRGVDVSFVRWRGYIEYTVEALGEGGPVEFTDDLSFSEPDLGRLERTIREALGVVRDRARATATPVLSDLPLVLAGKQAEAVLEYFWGNLNAARVFMRSAPFALGISVHGEGAPRADHDALTIRAEPFLEGAPESAPFDPEGFRLERTTCAEDGVATAFVGPSRYANYLGLRVAGSFPLFSVGPGSKSSVELRAAPHLEVVAFSDFTVNPNSGDFGGEIRLGYWFDGKKRVPVTGGSVTGSLLENRGGLRLSRELALSGSMHGPEALLLPKVSVTGSGS